MMRILKRIPKFSNEKKYYYSSGSYFKETLKQYSNVESYIRLLKYNDKLALFSDKNISFSDNPDFKKKPKKYILKHYGKPINNIVNDFSFGKINIMFYPIYLGNYKVKLVFHLFQKSLIMYSYEFPHLENESKKKTY